MHLVPLVKRLNNSSSFRRSIYNVRMADNWPFESCPTHCQVVTIIESLSGDSTATYRMDLSS